jgi:heat-inducible transcriptional repressor
MHIFSRRAEEILRAVVQDYISTAEPVSSKAIASGYGLRVSAATIRNIMAELESEGFLAQPHTSAGRIPTDRGFRFYVDSLLELEEPGKGDKDILRKSCEKARTVEDILTETTKALSRLTSCAGLMFMPRKDDFVIKHISFMPIDRANLMVVLVSSLGMVQTKLIKMDTETSRLDFDKVSGYLNSVAKGLTITELRATIVTEMNNEKNQYDELLKKALSLGGMLFQLSSRPEENSLYVEGKFNMLDQPEFRDDFERMKKLFAAFEQKGLLLEVLDKSMEENGIHVFLGSESAVEEFEGLSFVVAPYGSDGETLGTLGVVGPVRMNYSKIVPLVDYTAGLLSKVF